jgi:hypothetical protein
VSVRHSHEGTLFSPQTLTKLDDVLMITVGLGLAFQVGHFLEHGIQFPVWVPGSNQWLSSNICGRDTPFMSWPVTELVRFVGDCLFPDASVTRQMVMGMEILHLSGNTIFLTTIAGVYYFIPSKWVRYAFYIEGAHLCEHIWLTLSAYFVGIPIGVSTLFGQAPAWLGKSDAIGFRVSFHFLYESPADAICDGGDHAELVETRGIGPGRRNAARRFSRLGRGSGPILLRSPRSRSLRTWDLE